MKRRELITRAGAAALSSTLAACGVGSGDPTGSTVSSKELSEEELDDEELDDEELDDEELDDAGGSDEIAAGVILPPYTIPKYLVDKAGIYQVEVSFRSLGKCEVYMSTKHNGGIESKLIASKPRESNGIAKTGFAYLKNVQIAPATLEFHVYNSNDELTIIKVGGSNYLNLNVMTHERARYVSEPRGNKATWWTFFEADGTTVLGYVHFYKLGSNAKNRIVFPADRFIKAVVNNASRDGGLIRHHRFPKLHPTTLGGTSHEDALSYESRILRHIDNGNEQTLILPIECVEVYGSQGYELVPTYWAASKKLKPLLRRRLGRHAKHVNAKLQEQGYILNDPSDVDLHHFIGNEILRLFGGEALIAAMQEKANEFKTKVIEEVDKIGDEFHDFCVDHISIQPYAQGVDAQIRDGVDRVLQDNPGVLSHAGGGVTASVLAQIGMSSSGYATTIPMFNNLGAGLRLSVGLAKYGVLKVQGQPPEFRNGSYVNQNGQVSFSATLKIKLIQIADFSADIELTVSCMSMKGQGVRVNFVQFDPVFDFVGGKFARWLWHKMANKFGVPDIPAINSAGEAIPGVSARLQATREAWGVDDDPAAPSDMVTKMRQSTSKWGGFTLDDARFKVLELSPFRFYFFNTDVNSPSVGFRRSWQGGLTVGWQPGIKMLGGLRLQGTKYTPSIPLPPPPVLPEGVIKTVIYARLILLIDSYGQFGSDSYIQAASYPWGT